MRTSLRWLLSPLVCVVVLLASPPARASIYTDLATAFDKGNPFDVFVSVGYQRTLKRGAIKREIADNPSTLWIAKDLRFSQVRHTLNLRADISLWKDLQFHVGIPVVLSDERSLSFAQNDGDPCGKNNSWCVDKSNTTLGGQGAGRTDGLLGPFNSSKWGNRKGGPDITKMGPSQIDVAGTGSLNDNGQVTGGPAGGYGLPRRSGLDQIHFGLSWAPINQRRDPTLPTWVIGFEARIAVGDYMRYNPYHDPTKDETVDNPKTNSAVGRGLHQFHWWMTVSRRYRYVDPYMTFFYMFPLASNKSLFKETTFEASGQERHQPIHRGGVEAGVEFIPWERPDRHQKFTIELGGSIQGAFEGRGYSEMWEVFANNPVLEGPCRPSPGSFNPRFWDNGTFCNSPNGKIPYPGITSIENHAIFHAAMAFNLEMTKYFRARLGVSLGHEQQHYITFADSGRNVNKVDPRIEYTREEEVNPIYRPYFDMVGRRYRVGETTIFDFFLSVQGRF